MPTNKDAVLVKVLQRNETNRMCAERETEREIFILKNWFTQLRRLESSKSEIQVQRPSVGRIPSHLGEENLLFYSGLQVIS